MGSGGPVGGSGFGRLGSTESMWEVDVMMGAGVGFRVELLDKEAELECSAAPPEAISAARTLTCCSASNRASITRN
jgi:hypothetical protein